MPLSNGRAFDYHLRSTLELVLAQPMVGVVAPSTHAPRLDFYDASVARPAYLSAGESEMRNAAWRTDRLNMEALLKFFETVPQPFPASENDRHDNDMHVVDEIGCQELSNGCWSSANSDIQATRRFPGGF